MYSNNFVVCIMHNGEALTNSKAGVVALPFGAEYKIRLRNKNNRRAGAQVFLDGEEVTDGFVIISANDYTDLDCHVLSRKRLKFVSADSGEATDAGKDNKDDDSNGVVKVVWRLEKEYQLPPPIQYIPHWYNSMWQWYSYPPVYGIGSAEEKTSGGIVTPNCQASNTCDFEGVSNNYKLQEGCTVEGSVSNQNFRTVYLELEVTSTIIQLILKGFVNKPKQGKCDRCKHQNSKKAKFCSFCGNPLTKCRQGV